MSSVEVDHLPEGEAVQHHRVPLVLQRLEDGGDGGGRGRLRLHKRRALDLNKLVLRQRLLVDRVHAVVSEELLDQTPLKNLTQVVNKILTINLGHKPVPIQEKQPGSPAPHWRWRRLGRSFSHLASIEARVDFTY